MGKPVILHTEESNGWAGQEIRILEEMLGIKERGYEVLLATPGHTSIYKRARDAGIETFDVSMKKTSVLSGILGIKKIIKKERGVGIVNTHSSRDSWVGSLAGRLSGVKVVRTRHISSALNKSPLTRFAYGPLCDCIMTTGEFIKSQLVTELGVKPDKIFSVPTGIRIERFRSAGGQGVRAELGLAAEDIVLGMAAAIRSWKGHEYLLQAMPPVLKEYPGVRLVLAGDGPMRPWVEGWIKEMGLGKTVHLTGHREDIPEVINSFDISLLVSYASEGIPQFVLQSMAAGKPVIGTTVGGIPEVVRDGVNGLLVPPKDPDAIAAAVKSMLSDRARMERMGEAGYRMAVEAHSYENMLDKIEEIYGRTLKGRI